MVLGLALHAHKAKPPLVVAPVPASDTSALPMTFSIALGVRPEDSALQASLDEILQQREREIKALLRRWSVPLMAADTERSR